MKRAAPILLVLALCCAVVPVAAQQPAREYIYGAELMSPTEREQYRQRLRKAQTADAQGKVRDEHRARIRERARQRGVQLVEPAGTLKEKQP